VQKAHLERIQSQGGKEDIADKENCKPQTSSSKLDGSSHDYERRFRNERKVSSRAKAAKEKALVALAESEQSRAGTLSRLATAKGHIEKLATDLNECRERNSAFKKASKALKMRVARIPEQRSRAAEKAQRATQTFKLKKKGVIPNNIRSMITKLTHHGVPTENVNAVIQTVAEGAEMTVDGSVHCRTTSRIISEVGIAANLQFAEAVSNSSSKY